MCVCVCVCVCVCNMGVVGCADDKMINKYSVLLYISHYVTKYKNEYSAYPIRNGHFSCRLFTKFPSF